MASGATGSVIIKGGREKRGGRRGGEEGEQNDCEYRRGAGGCVL